MRRKTRKSKVGRGKSYSRYYEISDFTGGESNVAKPTTFGKNEFKELKNYNITRHKGLEKRGGMEKLYSTTSGASTDVKDLYEYKAPNRDNYVLTAIGTKIRAYYDAQWNDLKTGLTAGTRYDFVTHRGFCYICNGVDDNFKLYKTTSYVVGIEKPLAAPVVAAIATGTDALTSTHPTANADTTGKLRSVAAETLIAQSFKLPADYDLSKVALKVRKVGTPSGGTPAMWVEIHTSPVGTSATKNASTNIVTASSASVNVDPTGLTTSFASQDFTFSTAPSCSKDTTYYLVVYGDFTVSTTNYVEVGFDNTDSSYSEGMYHKLDGSLAWTDIDTIDLVFEVYGTPQSEEELVNTGSIETDEDQDLMYDTSSYLLAQSFQITATATIDSLRIPLKEVGNIGTDNLWAEIHSSTTGTSATKGASTNLVTNATTTDISKTVIDNDEFTWVTLTFGTAPSLTGSTTYYLVLYSSGTVDTDNYVEWAYDSGTAYASGTGYKISSAFAWGDFSADFSFKVYGTQTAAKKGEEYALTNLVDYKALREDASHQMLAQAFVSDVSADCTKVVLYLSEVGTIAAAKTIWVEIHDGQDGTSATGDASTRLNGTKSATVDPTTLSAYPTYDAVTFTFTGTDPTLVKDTTYYIVLYGDYTASTTNYVKVQYDKLSPHYADGTAWAIDTSEAWTELPNIDLTFQVHQVTGGQTGDYKYVYTYKRSDIRAMESNPSDESEVVQPSAQSVNVTVVASTDTQVDDIVIYRTDASGETFYKVDEVTNAAQTYKDDYDDTETTTEVEFDNNVPPKAKYLVLHKDRIFYMNCPDEESGDSLVMWSKSGNGEQSPTNNYQYFDKEDGEAITGGASLSDYLLVFKRNKIGILAGELTAESELWYLSAGIGCIAGYAILPFEDKVLFLSEEGWKETDGKNIWSLSTQMNGLIEDGYFTTGSYTAADEAVREKGEDWSAVYYPEKEQFQYLTNNDTLANYAFVGHFLVPLLLEQKGASELETGNIIGWTRHQYANHELTCLGTYTNSSGITKVIAGASDGFVYELDYGTDDDDDNISTLLVTDWLTLGLPSGVTKTIRRGYLEWTASASTTATFTIDIDYADTDDHSTLTNDSTGTLDGASTAFSLKGSGRVFRLSLVESSIIGVDVAKMTVWFRDEGLR